MEAVKADAGLQEQLSNAASDSDAVVAIAKTAGFVISAEELMRAQAEISEDELEGIDGGRIIDRIRKRGCVVYYRRRWSDWKTVGGVGRGA